MYKIIYYKTIRGDVPVKKIIEELSKKKDKRSQKRKDKILGFLRASGQEAWNAFGKKT
jgi:hypothetical protein